MRKIKQRIVIMVVVCALGLSGAFGAAPFYKAQPAQAFSGGTEVRAVWLAYVDFSALGLKTDNETTFKNNAAKFLNKARANQINTVYFHVRAFDDAAWKSKTFKPSQFLTSKPSFSFDPLKDMVALAHARGMELHAWMNPYRISMNYFLDPSLQSTTDRINEAVKEVMAYHVDGIHFDDYFYNAKKGYKNVQGQVTITAGKAPFAAKKRAYVNKMVKSVYSTVKSIDQNAKFGISPQGNIGNCRSGGADIDKWLSASGYVDYIEPQIYWTNQWGSNGKTTMFSDRLKAWKALNKNGTPLYVGLASYRTGISYSDDKGWGRSSANLANQLNLLRHSGCKGYALFSAKDLYRGGAQTELRNLNKVAGRIPTAGLYNVDYQTIQVKWNWLSGVKGYRIYRASAKSGIYKSIKTVAGATTTSYNNTGLKPGKKYYYKVKSYRPVSGKTVFSKASSVKGNTAKPKTPKISSQAGPGNITVAWKTIPKTSGYVIYKATGKTGYYAAIKTLKSGAAIQYKNSGLVKGKRYYYKVRAYKLVSGKRIYSSYSLYTTKAAK